MKQHLVVVVIRYGVVEIEPGGSALIGSGHSGVRQCPVSAIGKPLNGLRLGLLQGGYTLLSIERNKRPSNSHLSGIGGRTPSSISSIESFLYSAEG
ncbi:Uncharacterized protein HZ326_27305 [Fusarium oxysporum f. sp. albedinis]|nr:Uncharacterized protein HZ326_27305 [Fusarium oxysporum f. sp. albedinis]